MAHAPRRTSADLREARPLRGRPLRLLCCDGSRTDAKGLPLGRASSPGGGPPRGGCAPRRERRDLCCGCEHRVMWAGGGRGAESPSSGLGACSLLPARSKDLRSRRPQHSQRASSSLVYSDYLPKRGDDNSVVEIRLPF